MNPVDAFTFLGQLDLESFVLLFWYLIVFDFGRYSLSIAAVIIERLLPSRKTEPYRGAVSILLVGHNEGPRLQKSVRSLEEQTYPGITQVVVVDDGSTDATARIGKRLKADRRIHTFVSTGIRGGKAAALNLGFRYCLHPVVVTADIDTSFDRDAVERLVQPFGDPTVGAVAGNLGVRNTFASTLTVLQSMQYLFSISLGRRFTSMMGWLLIVSGAFGAFRRAAIEVVGGWDVGPGDDSNLTTKIRRSGWDVRFAPDAWALTDVPVKMGQLVRQQLRWNRSIVRNRLRKFRSVFNPFHAHFALRDALAFFNILFFQVVLSVSFVAYLTWLMIVHTDVAPMVILTVSLIYMIEDLVVLCIAALFYRERVRLGMLLYLPLLTFYKSYFLRFLRVAAYIDELAFRRSYRDSFYPSKVRNSVDQF